MAFSGATIYELDDSGASAAEYDDVETVALWRRFLEAPERIFRHLFTDD